LTSVSRGSDCERKLLRSLLIKACLYQWICTGLVAPRGQRLRTFAFQSQFRVSSFVGTGCAHVP
jgi:hypothetical protein